MKSAKMAKKPGFLIWMLLTLLCMGAIFVFSSFDADSSTAQSDYLAQSLFGSLKLTAAIRVTAHFLSFAVLGFCAANTLKFLLTGKELVIVSLCFSAFYALTDEFHQIYVPGRAFQLSDLLVDTLGALLGIGAAYFIWKIKRRKENKQP